MTNEKTVLGELTNEVTVLGVCINERRVLPEHQGLTLDPLEQNPDGGEGEVVQELGALLQGVHGLQAGEESGLEPGHNPGHQRRLIIALITIQLSK